MNWVRLCGQGASFGLLHGRAWLLLLSVAAGAAAAHVALDSVRAYPTGASYDIAFWAGAVVLAFHLPRSSSLRRILAHLPPAARAGFQMSALAAPTVLAMALALAPACFLQPGEPPSLLRAASLGANVTAWAFLCTRLPLPGTMRACLFLALVLIVPPLAPDDRFSPLSHASDIRGAGSSNAWTMGAAAALVPLLLALAMPEPRPER